MRIPLVLKVPVQCEGVSECFESLLNYFLNSLNPLKSYGWKSCVCRHFLYEPLFVFFLQSEFSPLRVECVWRLSPVSSEFTLQSLTKPWLGFDHFPVSPHLTLLSAIPPFFCFSLCLSLSPLLYLDQPFMNLFASSFFFSLPFLNLFSTVDKRARACQRETHPSRNQKCRALRLHMNSYTPCNCCQRALRQLT